MRITGNIHTPGGQYATIWVDLEIDCTKEVNQLIEALKAPKMEIPAPDSQSLAYYGDEA